MSGGTTSRPSFGRFFLPGPTEVPPDLLAAMQRPVIGHRSPEISALIGEMRATLSGVFQTERPVYLSTSSATGMMEAAITNLTRRRVLCLVNGSFSHRFYDIARATGRPADRLEVEWGAPNLADALHDALVATPGRYDLVTVVHSESSTGVLNPLADLARVVHELDDVLIAVDAVSSLAGAPVRTDEWGLDFVLTGSQKALALPPGLALAAASERALERAREVEHRGFYFDLLRFEKRLEMADQTPNTPAVSLLFALERQLVRIAEEGIEARWERHRRMAERTVRWVEDATSRTRRPFRVLAPEGYRSPCLTVIMLPDGLTGPEVVALAKERGFTIAAGYGKFGQGAFRIGHMGEHTVEELETLLETLDGIVG
ncbi:MAG: pyridoxal-phosphate-dependent aminotransferase family protein [Gemmatimonadota bacterium]